MKVKKLLALSVVICMSLNLKVYAAENNGFDANYYANKYPDVYAAFGGDTEKLYNHYVTFGIKEGRYQNAWEEENGIVNSSNINVVNTKNIPCLPGYSTYVDVDISEQTMTYFQNGIAVLQSDCVTGKANGKRDTPCGTYKILTKIPGKRLKGPTWNVWVNRWMKFTNSNIGLHDASWRSSFGGNVYKSSGSHGCVNLPSDVAYQLYDMVNVGTTVIVHE